jgi:hypothetical protein
MIWQTKTLAHALGDKGCGLTIDGFRGQQGMPTLQWICSVPTPGGTDKAAPELYTEVLDMLTQRGFVPLDTPDPHLKTGLSNAVSVESECPYSPSDCPGEHILITGVGHFDPTATGWHN